MCNIIEFSDFQKIKLKVGKVLTAENIKGSNKLLKLSVDIGEQSPRTLVAGLAGIYKPDELIGKKIIVVTNMKPAKIFGVESNGMLLAAVNKDKVAILTVDSDIEVGSEVE